MAEIGNALSISRGRRLFEPKAIEVPFTFASPPSQILEVLSVGWLFELASILITQTFNGVGATIQLGTSASPGGILSASDVLPSTLGQYDTRQVMPVSVADNLLLTIGAAGSTQGQGLLLYRVRR